MPIHNDRMLAYLASDRAFVAPLTPPVFRPIVKMMIRDEVLNPVANELQSAGYMARYNGDESAAQLTYGRFGHVCMASFYVDVLPNYILDRKTGTADGIRRPHPADEFYRPSDRAISSALTPIGLGAFVAMVNAQGE